jgi:L-asparaginase II
VALTVATRSGHVESLHRGTLAVTDADSKVLVSAGDSRQRTYMRSSAKPFQAMALILTGVAGALHLTDRDIAIAASSHSGEPEHVQAVHDLLDKGCVSASALQCGIHPPLDAAAARALILAGQRPTPLHNNCSGKHASMLVISRFMGWPLETYLAPSHPVQTLNLETLAAFTGERRDEIGIAVDGCGVPVFYVRVQSVATAFARLATGECVDARFAEAAGWVRAAMMAHPFLLAGSGRFDTQLMTAGRGSIVSKGGAQGGQGVGLLNHGLGMGLKISDGSSGSIGLITVACLDALGALDREMQDQLAEHRDLPVRNHAGTVVGSMLVTFSIDGTTE